MLVIGLTGSIATGKSSVSSLLSKDPYNIPVIDADLLARQAVEPGTPGYAKIVSQFLPTTPDLLLPAEEAGGADGPHGKGRPLNRSVLGRRVFGDSEERRKDRMILNQIVHPAVRAKTYRSLLHYYIRGYWAVILDVPLLFESGTERLCGCVIVVAVQDPEIQMKRLTERDSHLSAEDAQNRVLSQVDVREKARRAEMKGPRGFVIWNDGDKKHLQSEVRRVTEKIRSRHPRWWSWLLFLVPPLGALSAAYQVLRSWMDMKKWLQTRRNEKAKL